MVGADSEPQGVTGRRDSGASQRHGSGGSHFLSSPSARIPQHHPERGRLQMGDQEAERTMPWAELEEISSKISDLNKWREIFSFHG